MNDKERAMLKQILVSEVDNTRYDISRLEELTQPIAPDNAIGRLSRMEALNSKSVNEAALDSAVARLGRLEQALAKVDSEEFGNCQKCSKPIQVKRLMVVPESTHCVSCEKARRRLI